jgi:hypothetical protein
MPKFSIPPGLDFMAEVNVSRLGEERDDGLGDVTGLADAIGSARDKGLSCYLVQDGVPVAAIVPVRR